MSNEKGCIFCNTAGAEKKYKEYTIQLILNVRMPYVCSEWKALQLCLKKRLADGNIPRKDTYVEIVGSKKHFKVTEVKTGRLWGTTERWVNVHGEVLLSELDPLLMAAGKDNWVLQLSAIPLRK